MISGRQALAQIEQTIEKARQQEAQLEQGYAAAVETVGRLRVQRTEGFRELAGVKLDAIAKEAVQGELDAAERQALSLLDSRKEALRQLSDRRHEAEERVRQAEARRQAEIDALENALAEVEGRRKKVEAEVTTSPDWVAAKARVKEITGHAQQAEKKAVQAEADRDEKRRPYEDDPLFMYLWKRKFGAAAYRAGPFTRYMDRIVARVVGYDRARANYALLNEIPERLREHARRIINELREERERLTKIERQALVSAGIESLEARAAQAKEAVEAANRDLGEARDALAVLDRSHDAAVFEADAPYRDAVALLAEADQRQDLNQLYEAALRTPSPHDEEIVRRIQATDTLMDQALRQAVEAHRQLKELGQRRAILEREWDGLRRQGYDTPYGGFRNEAALGNTLGGVLTGAIGGAILGQILRGGFHQGPSPWDSDFGGGMPFPEPDSFTTGGSFGGEDFDGGSF